jgi:chemotaxis protein MotB
MALGRRGRERAINYWPGFVDALSTLLLVFTFLLTVFVVAQFFLTQEITGKESALNRLQTQLKQLSELLSLERSNSGSLEDQLAALRATLKTAETERDKLRAGGGGADVKAITTDLDNQKDLNQRAASQIDILNLQIAALRRQLAALEEALDASEKRNKESTTRISDLSKRLNVALAQRVQELARYRSEFFGRLREVLGNRPDVRIVGDRFVFQSEILFDAGSAQIKPAGYPELDKLASTLTEISRKIPKDIPWILRVDGHTDVRPIATAQFPSNWELSSARATSVVQYLISKGFSAQHLAAAGFGEFQPIDSGNSEDAFRRNRRIEFKLTER